MSKGSRPDVPASNAKHSDAPSGQSGPADSTAIEPYAVAYYEDVEAGIREHYQDAALYDYEYRRRRNDARFYVQVAAELAGRPARILELACGSGRVTVPLLRAGHSVVGLDLSQTMLARAHHRVARLGRAARARAALICADMRRFALARRFPLVFMAFNSFEHLYTRVDVSACLTRVRHHLEPSGQLVFDVQNPDLRWLSRDPTKRWARTKFTHPETGERMVYSTNHEYDAVSQIAVIRLYYEWLAGGRPERVVRLSQRKFFPAELEALLHANGFEVTARYGDFDGNPLDDDGEIQMIVCRPGPEKNPVETAPDDRVSGRPVAQRGDNSASHRSSGGAEDGAEIVAKTGITRDRHYLYYIESGRIVRVPRAHGADGAAELIADPEIEVDHARYVYFLDARGHIARVRRPS